MDKRLIITVTDEFTDAFSKNKENLPIVIINNKKYVKCYKGAYYISTDEEDMCCLYESIIFHRIYRINPSTKTLEQGGYIQYIENLDRSTLKNTCWVSSGAKVFGDIIVKDNAIVGGNIIIGSNIIVGGNMIIGSNIIVGGNKVLNSNIKVCNNTEVRNNIQTSTKSLKDLTSEELNELLEDTIKFGEELGLLPDTQRYIIKGILEKNKMKQ